MFIRKETHCIIDVSIVEHRVVGLQGLQHL